MLGLSGREERRKEPTEPNAQSDLTVWFDSSITKPKRLEPNLAQYNQTKTNSTQPNITPAKFDQSKPNQSQPNLSWPDFSYTHLLQSGYVRDGVRHWAEVSEDLHVVTAVKDPLLAQLEDGQGIAEENLDKGGGYRWLSLVS